MLGTASEKAYLLRVSLVLGTKSCEIDDTRFLEILRTRCLFGFVLVPIRTSLFPFLFPQLQLQRVRTMSTPDHKYMKLVRSRHLDWSAWSSL